MWLECINTKFHWPGAELCFREAGHLNILRWQPVVIVPEIWELVAAWEIRVDATMDWKSQKSLSWGFKLRKCLHLFLSLSGRCARLPGMKNMRLTTSCSSKYIFSLLSGNAVVYLSIFALTWLSRAMICWVHALFYVIVFYTSWLLRKRFFSVKMLVVVGSVCTSQFQGFGSTAENHWPRITVPLNRCTGAH